RLGYRATLALGCLGYAVRFALFALGPPDHRTLVGAAMTLHGLCYACFFASAYMYVERVARKDARHPAQTVFGIIILGGGPVLAGLYNEWLESLAHPAAVDSVTVWSSLWWVQSAIGLASALFVAALFRPGIAREAPGAA